MYTTISEEEHIIEENKGLNEDDSNYYQPLPPDTILPHCALVPCPGLNPDVMGMLDQALKEGYSKYNIEIDDDDKNDEYSVYNYAACWDMKIVGFINFTRESLIEFVGCNIPVEKWNKLGMIDSEAVWASPGILSSCKLSFKTLSTFVASICGRYVNCTAWMNLRNANNSYEAIKASCLEAIEKECSNNEEQPEEQPDVSYYINQKRLQSFMKEIPLQIIHWRVFAYICHRWGVLTCDEWIYENTHPTHNELNAFLCGIGANPISSHEWIELDDVCRKDYMDDINS
jgi:hypothetical protein